MASISDRDQAWTDEEDQMIHDVLAAMGGTLLLKWPAVCARLPGRSQHSIIERYKQLNMGVRTIGNWTAAEDRVILGNMDTPWNELSALLPGRSSRDASDRKRNHLTPEALAAWAFKAAEKQAKTAQKAADKAGAAAKAVDKAGAAAKAVDKEGAAAKAAEKAWAAAKAAEEAWAAAKAAGREGAAAKVAKRQGAAWEKAAAKDAEKVAELVAAKEAGAKRRAAAMATAKAKAEAEADVKAEAEAKAKAEAVATAAARVQHYRSLITSRDSAVTLALIQEIADQPELSGLVAELYAELRARLEQQQEEAVALLGALLKPHEPLTEERERLLPATVRQDGTFRKWLLGGEARVEAEALLRERATDAARRVVTDAAERGDAAEVEGLLCSLQGKLSTMAYALVATSGALALIGRTDVGLPLETLLSELERMQQAGGVLARQHGLGAVRDRICALLKARVDAAQEAAFREHWATQPASPGGPASLSQQKLDYTYTNPTDFENWHPHLGQWAMRMGLHLRWNDLAHVPGGVQLRAENMLNALSGFMMLTVDGKDVASIAVSETYGQQVPALGTDVREWLLRGWWWRLDGKLVFVGCVQSARQLAYLLHNRTGARLPHSPPKPGDGLFTPFNVFLDPRFHLCVVAPTEMISQVNVLLARRVVAKRKSQLKFEDASAPGANKPRSMGDLQFDALQRHPDAHLMYVANPSDAADYTPAGRLPYWFAAFCAPPDSPPLDEANIGETLQRFEEQGCRLTDAGPLACNEKAFSDWKAQPSQPAPEDGKVMVDPASCTKHFTGNTTTRKLPPNCLAETSYGVTTPDPDAPPELPTDQSTGLTVVRAGRMHPQRG